MELTQEQLEQFDREGYLFLPNLFSPEEAAFLKGEAETIYGMDRKEVWRENGVARTAFAAHQYNEGFRRLGAHPASSNQWSNFSTERYTCTSTRSTPRHRLMVRSGNGIKTTVPGSATMMPEPRAMNISVFLDDVTAANGPLLFIPGSHKHGVVKAGHDLETTSYPLWTLDRDTVTELAEQGGCVAPTGPAGSMLLFSSLLVHASPPNISPFGRTIVYLSLCEVSNHIRAFNREEWIAHRDFTPIEALEDDCLQELLSETA